MSRAYHGDEIFFHRNGTPVVGKVVASGKHGCTVEHEGKHHKVKWEHVSGFKSRVPQQFKVIEHGEEGLIVENQHGKRRYVGIPPEAREDATSKR